MKRNEGLDVTVQPILSICIPTYERPELLKKTLNSILSQDVDSNLYEICISDDSKTNHTEEIIRQYSDKNIHYQHIPPVSSYMNLLCALKMGQGHMLKLINDYSCIRDGGLKILIEDVQKNMQLRPTVFWSINGQEDISTYEYDSFDKFINGIGIFATWTLCFGIWKDEFCKLIKTTKIDDMFPHVSLLLEGNKTKHNFFIDNRRIYENQELSKKGGYSIPEVFGHKYLFMVKKILDEGHISLQTYNKQKLAILEFISDWKAKCKIVPEKYYFGFENDKTIMRCVYSKSEMKKYDLLYYKRLMIYILKRILRKSI